MSLGASSQQFPHEVATATSLPVQVETDVRLQPLLLAGVQLASPAAETGLPIEPEYIEAQKTILRQNKP